MNEISLEYNKFIGIRGQEWFTLKDALNTIPSRVSWVMVDLTHSWSWRTSPVLSATSLPNFFGLKWLRFFPPFTMDRI